MLLQRSLLLFDFAALFSVFILLVFMPAERCAHFEVINSEGGLEAKCDLHPNAGLVQSYGWDHQLHTSICHRLKWSHYNFWKNMYIIILPAIICFVLCFLIVCELAELDMFRGRFQMTGVIIFSFICVIYVTGIICHERLRIHNDWPLLHNSPLGGQYHLTNVESPATWQYSIALCILSALFKIGRIVIQHFFGDSKMFFDDTIPKSKKTSRAEEVM